jgi:hypothetical protein
MAGGLTRVGAENGTWAMGAKIGCEAGNVGCGGNMAA